MKALLFLPVLALLAQPPDGKEIKYKRMNTDEIPESERAQMRIDAARHPCFFESYEVTEGDATRFYADSLCDGRTDIYKWSMRTSRGAETLRLMVIFYPDFTQEDRKLLRETYGTFEGAEFLHSESPGAKMVRDGMKSAAAEAVRRGLKKYGARHNFLD